MGKYLILDENLWGLKGQIPADCVGSFLSTTTPPYSSTIHSHGFGHIILRSTEEAVQGAYYGPGLQLPTEREA